MLFSMGIARVDESKIHKLQENSFVPLDENIFNGRQW